nr:hypothetical protein [Actinomycetota bacterium]
MNERDDDKRLGSPRNPIAMSLDDVIVLYEAAVERDDFERADVFLSAALSYYDPPKVDA